MSADDENRFRPKPGRIRSDAPRTGKTKSFFTQAKKIARQHSASPSRSSPRSASRPGKSPTGKSGKASRSTKGPGVQRGRGAAFVRARTVSGGWRHSAPGMRRVVVKTRYIQYAGRNGKSAAHLRYIQRDGTSRDGERGQLYSATEDRADGDAFVERGKDDERQFRFIISPEDGADLTDLTAHTRDLMSRIESDLGTKLDWVAVNHYNTGHPHVHVIVRGKDDLGENLVINGDYLGVASGMGGVARAAGSAAISPLKRAVAHASESVKSSFSDGVKAGFGATGGTSSTGSAGGAAAPPASSQATGTPFAWAQRMRQGGHMGHAVQTAAHAVRSDDSHGSGSSINLSESDRS